MTKQFLDALRNLGVNNGDILHISSDITAFVADLSKAGEAFDLNESLHNLIDGLQDMLGENGTLLFPIFSWGFNKLAPKYLHVKVDFNPRGNVHTIIEINSNQNAKTPYVLAV